MNLNVCVCVCVLRKESSLPAVRPCRTGRQTLLTQHVTVLPYYLLTAKKDYLSFLYLRMSYANERESYDLETHNVHTAA